MEFQEFKSFIHNSIEIIIADLDKLQQIADDANKAIASSTLTVQTSKRPDDDDYTPITKSLNISRCTIPMVMVCFSVIDMIGQWLKEYKDDDFGSSAHSFFLKLSNKDDLKKPDSQSKIKTYIRNGIMHSFFAKKGYSVTYPPYEGNSLFSDIDGIGTTLDARYLLQVVRSGLNRLESEIQKEKSEISQKAFNGYKDWLK